MFDLKALTWFYGAMQAFLRCTVATLKGGVVLNMGITVHIFSQSLRECFNRVALLVHTNTYIRFEHIDTLTVDYF